MKFTVFLLDSSLPERECFHMSKYKKKNEKKNMPLQKERTPMLYCVGHSCLFFLRLLPCYSSTFLVINMHTKYFCRAHNNNRSSVLFVPLDCIPVEDSLDKLNDLFVHRPSSLELKTKTWPCV